MMACLTASSKVRVTVRIWVRVRVRVIWPLGKASDCWFCNGEKGPKGLFVGHDLKDLISLPL